MSRHRDAETEAEAKRLKHEAHRAHEEVKSIKKKLFLGVLGVLRVSGFALYPILGMGFPGARRTEEAPRALRSRSRDARNTSRR
jgi:hypothetical protein